MPADRPTAPGNDPRALWKEQPVTVTTYSPDDLRARLGRQQRMFRVRNWIEYGAGVLVLAAFGGMAMTEASPISQAGCVMVMVATVFVLWELNRRASAPPPPAGGDLLAFQRAQLQRQHDALRSVPVWYLAPFLPGMVLLTLGRFHSAPTGAEPYLWLSVAIMTAVFAAVWLLNHFAARRLARQIETLDRMGDTQ